jgi:hypothetical protein
MYLQISVAILVQGVVKRKGIAFIKDRQVVPIWSQLLRARAQSERGRSRSTNQGALNGL